MAVAVNDLLTETRYLLQDANKVRWTDAELLAWLNIGQCVVAIGKPDSSTTTGVLTLVAGTKQALPAGGLILVSLIRNMGADGQTPGRTIKPVDRGIIDTLNPDWHTETASGEVLYYVYDARAPKTFYVSPPQPVSPHRVEAIYSITPTVAVLGGNIYLDDVYRGILIDYICYRAYGKDDEVGDTNKSNFYMQSFMSTMGLKASGDAALTLSQQAEVAMAKKGQQ